ncbi:hypothetical protein MP228_002975 [Amoeboaphelidium protococcarum]|nr:hypothetical protein MP228_002975 [Amoeboaphelidium protococcarum]
MLEIDKVNRLVINVDESQCLADKLLYSSPWFLNSNGGVGEDRPIIDSAVDVNEADIKKNSNAQGDNIGDLEVDNRLTMAIISEKIQQVYDCDREEDAFFVADLGEIIRQHVRWKMQLPRVAPFYAVKCNTDMGVLNTLVKQGIGFDCASKSEIKTMLDLGVQPEKIIYANPTKQASHIKFAATQNVRKMTFDNADELHKIKLLHPSAQLVLRILTDDSHSVCKLGTKFGASESMVEHLLRVAAELELDVIGVSFHVGSGCFNAKAFSDAIIAARRAFDLGRDLGFNFTLLDIGGGFPSNQPAPVSFEEIADVIRQALDVYFPQSMGVNIIAEPGRFFVASAFTLAVQITARRSVQDAESGKQSFMYYVNDGVYGSFNCILFDHAVVEPLVYRHGTVSAAQDAAMHPCSIWGPSCDSMDCITKNSLLPKLEIGDWLYFENTGAYTICAASNFNGFKKSDILYTRTL